MSTEPPHNWVIPPPPPSWDEQWDGVAEEDRPLYSYNELKSESQRAFGRGIIYAVAMYLVVKFVMWYVISY